MATRQELQTAIAACDAALAMPDDVALSTWQKTVAAAQDAKVSVYESADAKPLTTDEEYDLIVSVEVPLLTLQCLEPGIKLATAKNRAQSLLQKLKYFEDNFQLKDAAAQKAIAEKIAFLRQRAAVIVGYPGNADDQAPAWSQVVGGPFWQYPPRQAGMGWLLALGAVVAGWAYWRNK